MSNLFNDGKKLYGQRQFDESAAVFAKLAADPEYHPAGHYGLGVIYYARGKTVTARDEFRKCIEGAPGQALSANALHYLGMIALAQRDIAGSLSLHYQAIDRNPDHFGSARQVDLLERYTVKYAKALYRARKFDKSTRLFNSLLRSRSYKAAGLYGLGVIALQKGNLGGAQNCLEQCVTVHPRHANAWYYLGRIAEKSKHSEAKVRECYEKSLAINPAHAGALMRTKHPHKSSKDGHEASPLKSRARSPKHPG